MKNNILSKYFKYLLVIVAVLLFPLIASGCWDSKDINEKLIITAIAFDIKEDEIIYYIELAEINKAQGDMGGGRAKFTSIKAHGKTLSEAKKNLDEKLNRPFIFQRSSSRNIHRKFC
jgi:spore germination protein KC